MYDFCKVSEATSFMVKNWDFSFSIVPKQVIRFKYSESGEITEFIGFNIHFYSYIYLSEMRSFKCLEFKPDYYLKKPTTINEGVNN